jgi:hypothetical protein
MKNHITILLLGLVLGFGIRYYQDQQLINSHYEHWVEYFLIHNVQKTSDKDFIRKGSSILKKKYGFPDNLHILNLYKGIGTIKQHECYDNKNFDIFVDDDIEEPKFQTRDNTLLIPSDIKKDQLEKIFQLLTLYQGKSIEDVDLSEYQ